MTEKEYVLETMRSTGKAAAQRVQEAAPEMTGTELYAQEQYIPDFSAAVAAKNMLERSPGFVCRSTAGRVVRLLQVYDSTTYPQEPEELTAQWGFAWSTDPDKALPFVSIATSPYMTGDCCTEDGHVWRSTIDNNVWAPSGYPQGWTDLGEVGAAESEEPGTKPEEPEATTYPEWVQPTGAEDAYNTGAVVTYNGKVYQSLMDGNVWSPAGYPQGWQEVEA